MFQVITLPLFLLLCAAATVSSTWALTLIVLMFGIEQSLQTSSPIFLERSWLANVIVAAACGVCVMRVMASRPGTMQAYATPIWCGTVALYAWAFMSLVWTPSFEGATEIMGKGWPYFILFILIAPILLDDMRGLGRFARMLLYSGILVVLTLVLNPEFGTWSGRAGLVVAGKLITNPLAIGELGGTLIILAALLRTGPSPALLALARSSAFVLGAILALQSGSRGQLAFAVLIAVLFYPVSKRLKSIPAFFGTAIGVGTIAAVVFLLASIVLEGFAAQRWGAGELDAGFRQRMANAAELLGDFVTSPAAWVMGLGSNAFSSLNAVAAKDEYVHNLPVEILAELGIPMFAVFMALLYITAREGLTLFRRYANRPNDRAALSVLLALGAYQLLLACKQSNLWGNGMLFLFMILITRLQKRTAGDAEHAFADDGEHGGDDEHADGEGHAHGDGAHDEGYAHGEPAHHDGEPGYSRG